VSTFAIAGRAIGPEHPPYVIAEVSANHLQDLELARRIVIACADAGVDAVKLQTYTADTITLDVDRPEYLITEGPWAGERLHELYRRAMTPWEWTAELSALAASRGVHLFSTPFDPGAVDFLETCGVPAYKIASFELTYDQLLRRVGATGMPVIMSTGMATFEEIERALRLLRESGAEQVALLKCTSSYPADVADLNLALIPRMAADFNVPIGYSDHTIGTVAATAAVALGACIIEKHVKDVASDGSADAAFSTLPDELRRLVQDCRTAHVARGAEQYGPTVAEMPSLHFRRGVVAARDIARGAIIDADDLAVVRPAIGAEPRYLEQLVGTPSPRDFARGEGIPAPDA
jgi:N-acetylneuraminate synthase